MSKPKAAAKPTKPTKPTKKKPAVDKPASAPLAAAAFAAIEAEAEALQEEDLAVINIDIPQSVSVVLGVLPGLTDLRPRIVKELPEFKRSSLDKLERYALAAWYAHLLNLAPSQPVKPLKDLLAEGAKVRANLLSDAEALARRELLDGPTVAQIRAGHGNIDLANDLVALAALFTSNWSTIGGRTAATLEEIEQAGALGPSILAALGVRENAPVIVPAEAAERRARAFTLFVRAYDQVRRAVTYLRWDDGDADVLAPSLYRGRGGRGQAAAEEEVTEEKPGEEKPAEDKAAEKKPADPKPVADGEKPAEKKPAEKKPADPQPA